MVYEITSISLFNTIKVTHPIGYLIHKKNIGTQPKLPSNRAHILEK